MTTSPYAEPNPLYGPPDGVDQFERFTIGHALISTLVSEMRSVADFKVAVRVSNLDSAGSGRSIAVTGGHRRLASLTRSWRTCPRPSRPASSASTWRCEE